MDMSDEEPDGMNKQGWLDFLRTLRRPLDSSDDYKLHGEVSA